MALVRWNKGDLYDPWSSLRTLQEEINDLFDVDRNPQQAGLFDRSFSPSLDVVEGDKEFTVLCELPRVDQKDIELSLASNILTIKGHKEGDREEKKKKYYKKESWSGSFQRTLSLPSSIDADKVSAVMENGMLTVVIPKKEEAIPKQITVDVK